MNDDHRGLAPAPERAAALMHASLAGLSVGTAGPRDRGRTFEELDEATASEILTDLETLANDVNRDA